MDKTDKYLIVIGTLVTVFGLGGYGAYTWYQGHVKQEAKQEASQAGTLQATTGTGTANSLLENPNKLVEYVESKLTNMDTTKDTVKNEANQLLKDGYVTKGFVSDLLKSDPDGTIKKLGIQSCVMSDFKIIKKGELQGHNDISYLETDETDTYTLKNGQKKVFDQTAKWRLVENGNLYVVDQYIAGTTKDKK